jgi:hypothetical protein
MTIEELVAVVCPRIGDLGWTYYFDRATVAKGTELGLDVVHFYFLGRGGVLGDVEPEVVTSAFGYFNPTLVSQMWSEGRAVVAPRDAARAHWSCAADLGRARLSALPGLGDFCRSAGAVTDAADSVGLTLFAAFRAEPLVDDIPGRAMQLLALLREFRGSAHLLAVRVSGLDTKTAHFIRRPNDIGMFGWNVEDAPEMGPIQLAALAEADALTDALVTPAYSILDQAGWQALVGGLEEIESALAPEGRKSGPVLRQGRAGVRLD